MLLQVELAEKLNDIQMFEQVWTTKHKKDTNRPNNFALPKTCSHADADAFVYQIKPLLHDIIAIKYVHVLVATL